MKKYFFIGFVLVSLFSSCRNNNTSTDNVTVNNTSPINMEDSIKTSFPLEDAKVVYDKVNFGVTEKEYNKLMRNSYNRYKIGDYEYSFSPTFDDNGKLYLLEISSFYENASKIETELNDSKNNLIKVISQKYKEPTENYGVPDFFSFKPGYIQWQCKWSIHTKTILIGTSEENNGSRYKTVMWIYDKPVKDSIDNERETKSTKTRINDSDKF